jgi:sulfur-oxidizing protein SoxX
MQTKNKNTMSVFVGIVSLIIFSSASADTSRIEDGKRIAFDRTQGNCLACHMIADGELPGNTAPPLIAMQARFPEIGRLITQISNPLEANPNSMMPPFGLHNILTEDEINKVTEYLYTL